MTLLTIYLRLSPTLLYRACTRSTTWLILIVAHIVAPTTAETPDRPPRTGVLVLPILSPASAKLVAKLARKTLDNKAI